MLLTSSQGQQYLDCLLKIRGQLQYCREICQKHYYNKILKECVEQSFPNTGHSETVILFYIRMKTVVNVLELGKKYEY